MPKKQITYGKGNGSKAFIGFTDENFRHKMMLPDEKGVEKVINQVTLVGRMTKDPELRYTVEGKAVLNITLALNRHYRNTQGEIDADFVLCTLWNKTAENTAKFCEKGSIIGVVGRIQTRNYDDSNGKRIYVTEVVADSVKFMGGRPEEVKQTQPI